MKKYFILLKAAIVMFAAFTLYSCEKETETVSQSVIEQSTDSILTINGKRMEWKFNLKNGNKLSKGMIADEKTLYDLYIETYLPEKYDLLKTIKYEHKDSKNRTTNYYFKLLRIDRKSEPGKYFYVMLDNLNVKLDTACWIYGDNESNVSKYGRLYTWWAAKALAKKIKLQLPVYKKNEPTQLKISSPLPVTAKLMTYRDVADILECDNVGNTSDNGYTIDDNIGAPNHKIVDDMPFYYYDVFLAGLYNNTGDFDYSLGKKSLGGFRNTSQREKKYWDVWEKGWYTCLNECGFFWLDDNMCPRTANSDYDYCHVPLRVSCEDGYNYTAFINVPYHNMYGFSVRYIFEPMYK